MIQAKLKIGQPNDKFEQEADRVANQVMRMPEPSVRRQAAEEEEPVQAKPLATQITPLVQRQPAEEEEEPVQSKIDHGLASHIQRQTWLTAHMPVVQRTVPVAVREDDDKRKVQPKSLLQCQEENEDESAQTKTLLQRQENKEDEKPAQAKNVDGIAATLQRQEEEDESAQAKYASTAGPQLQRQEEKEDESAQTKSLLQRQEKKEEEKPAQAKLAAGLSYALQRQEEKEDESAQAMNVPRRQIHISPPGLRAKPGGNGEMHASSVVEARVSHSRGSGSVLPNDTRAFMEPRFGVDFSQVRVHTGTDAAQMSQDLNAQAFTVGRDIYFGNGKYNPQTGSGRQLLAHELTHTIQQGAAVQRKPQPVTRGPRQIQRGILGDIVSGIGSAVSGGAKWLLGKVAGFVKNIPGYTLLTVILGKDPITDEPVERTAGNLIGGFMSLIPGGAAMFENLKKSGTIEEAYAWLQQQIAALKLSWELIKSLFRQAWDSLSATDLLNPSSAFEKIKGIFAPPLTRIKNFAVSVGKKVLEFVVKGFLTLAGPFGAQVWALLQRAGDVLSKIVKDPIGFVKNLIKGLVQGIGQFAKNALKHLKAGISGWLFGALSGANITLPSKFDLKGIFHLVLQILGATYQAIRAKVVKALGPKGESIVSKVEKAVEFVKELVTKGPIALWERVKDSLSNLKETVFGAIIDWVKSTIIGKAIEKLISFFNPAGALIQAVIAIYNTVKFFIERINQIREFAASVFNSIAEIASGNLSKAANAVENAIAKSIPVIISFLASLIGLGGISKKIQEIIKKIRQPIDKAIGKVVGWIVEKAKKLFGSARKAKEMSPDERWKQGVKGVEGRLAETAKQGVSENAIRGKLPLWSTEFGFKSLSLNSKETPWKIEGEMSPKKKVTDVAPSGPDGSKDRPYPLYWPKEFDSIPRAALLYGLLKKVVSAERDERQTAQARLKHNFYLWLLRDPKPKDPKILKRLHADLRKSEGITGKISAERFTELVKDIHFHHVHPLFLGGPDIEKNILPVDAKQHLDGHKRLRLQSGAPDPPQGMPKDRRDLYNEEKHPDGTHYRIVDEF